MSDIPEIAYEHYLKVPVVQRKDYVLRFEEHIKGTFIHCDVYKWDKEVAKALGADFCTLCELHGGPIHALHDIRDRKHAKFLKLYGFQRLDSHDNHSEVWIRNK